MSNQIKLYALNLFLALSATGCVSGGGRVSLIGPDGSPLEPWWKHSSGELGDASKVRFDEKDYDTPEFRHKALVKRLTPILDREKHICVQEGDQKVPIFSPALAGLPDGRILICGGYRGTGSTIHNVQNKSFLFDAQNGKLLAGPPMHRPREGPNATTLKDGRVLVTGGESSEGIPLDVSEIYDPKSNSFTEFGKMCLPRSGHGVVQLNNGSVLIVGGFTKRELSTQTGALAPTMELLDLNQKHYSLAGHTFGCSAPILIPYEQDQAVIVGGWFIEDNFFQDGRWKRDWEIIKPSVQVK